MESVPYQRTCVCQAVAVLSGICYDAYGCDMTYHLDARAMYLRCCLYIKDQGRHGGETHVYAELLASPTHDTVTEMA